jgi:hypothetical protein
MTAGSPHTNSLPTTRPLRLTGLAAWTFALTPAVALGVALLYELGKPGHNGPQVIMGPPPWLVCLVLFVLGIPWFVAGRLSVGGIRGAMGLNLLLFLPTMVVVLFAGGGGIAALADFQTQWGPAAFLLSVAMTGAIYACLVWRDAWRASRVGWRQNVDFDLKP